MQTSRSPYLSPCLRADRLGCMGRLQARRQFPNLVEQQRAAANSRSCSCSISAERYLLASCALSCIAVYCTSSRQVQSGEKSPIPDINPRQRCYLPSKKITSALKQSADNRHLFSLYTYKKYAPIPVYYTKCSFYLGIGYVRYIYIDILYIYIRFYHYVYIF